MLRRYNKRAFNIKYVKFVEGKIVFFSEIESSTDLS
jgi:hypothetical protein